MSRNFPISTLQSFCSQDWIAKTYSEYLYDCANELADLMNVLSDGISKDYLDEKIEIADQLWSDNLYSIVSIVSTALPAGVNPTTVTPYDEIVETAFDTIMSGPDSPEKSAIQVKLDILISHNSHFSADWYEFPHYYTMRKYLDGLYTATEHNVEVMINQTKHNILNQLGLSADAPFSIPDGVVHIGDYVEQYIRQSNDLLESLSNGVSVYDYEGNLSFIKDDWNFNDMVNYLKSSFASAIAWATGFASAGFNTISDKLSYFSEKVSTFISDSTASFANTINVVKDRLLSAKQGVVDFFQYAAQDLGWTAVAEEAWTNIDETDIYDYTGASPMGAINFSTAKKIANATGMTILAAGYAVYSAAKALVDKAVVLLTPAVLTAMGNPPDLDLIDANDDSYCCANFRSQVVSHKITYEDLTSEEVEVMRNAMLSKLQKWIAIETYFGKMLFRFSLFEVLGPFSDLYSVKLTFDCQYAPRCLNYQRAIDLGLVTLAYQQTAHPCVSLANLTSSSAGAWLEFLADDYRPNDSLLNQQEQYVYMGFWLANCLMCQLGALCAKEIGEWSEVENDFSLGTECYIQTYYGPSESFTFEGRNVWYDVGEPNIYAPNPTGSTPVTNLNFIEQTCGYHKNANDTYRLDLFPCYSASAAQTTGNNTAMTLDMLACGFLTCWIYQQVDKKLHPTEYLYLPYYNNTYDITGGRYRIKTDTEHANVINVIANILLVIVVVVVGVIIVRKLVKIHKAKKIAKWSSKVGVLDQKMWNGGKLTRHEALTYYRGKAKLAKLDFAGSGLAGAGSMLQNLTSTVKDVQSVVVTQNTTNGSITSNGDNEIYDQIVQVKRLIK